MSFIFGAFCLEESEVLESEWGQIFSYSEAKEGK